MGNYFDNSDLLSVLLKWKRQVIFIVALAAVFSSILSFLIPKKFKSEAVVYPANLQSYSSETETEQLLQLCNSKEVMDSVIKHCNLKEHYGIDESYKEYYSALINKYKENVSFSKTEFESVLIEVIDIDAQQACNIVKMIISMVNNKAETLQQEKSWEVVRVKQTQLTNKIHEIDSMEKALTELRVKYGLLSYDVQVEEVVKRYLKERVKPGYNPNTSSSKEMTLLLGSLKEKGGEFIALSENLEKERAFYNQIKFDYENALKDANKELTYTNVVTYPKVSDTKAYPIRWLIVLMFVLSTFMVDVIYILLIERYKFTTK
ncbi:MAG: hypothetical protein A3K10_08170 [Bacteroidetes bacterium RIFCSPLOWO2_12_FULL_31_6]|nr:MAG: hypothetical protein A3K10_08170 [Bacteroidetes bacterium RIFCSPLOWO2_12_FULL_31_6]